jgi:YVTN family beta-propeller protein
MSKLWSKVKQFLYPSSEVEDDTQKRVKTAQNRAEVAELRAKEVEDLAQTVEDPAKSAELRTSAAWYHARADKLQKYAIILLLQKEWRRITAWDRIQEKKKDDQYLTQEGRYLKVGSDPICPDESFTILGIFLPFLEAEVKIFQDRQAIAYIPNTDSDTVSVIATDIHAVIDTIPVGKSPRGIVITPDGTEVYVVYGTNEEGISVIATDNHKVIATIPIPMGKNLEGVAAITPDGTEVYVTNEDDRSSPVFVIATDIHAVIATIPMERCPNAIAITPDSTEVYATNSFDVSVIATDKHEVIARIPIPVIMGGRYGHLSKIAITSDGTKAYVLVHHNTSRITVIATDTRRVIATIPMEGVPNPIAITLNSTNVYVVDYDNTVSVIAIDNHAVIATVPVGPYFKGVAITPDGTKIYMTNIYSNTISVIVTDNHEVITTIKVGAAPMKIAIGKWLIWQ